MANPHVSSTPDSEQSGIGFNLLAILVFVAVGGLALAYWIDGAGRALKRPAPEPDKPAVRRVVAGQELTIPANWIVGGTGQADGFSERVDLMIGLVMPAAGTARQNIAISLVPRARVRPSAQLLDRVYLHAFEAVQLDGPPGLVGKPLRGGNGYAAETVWYDALHANPFVAKCIAPVAEGEPAQCIRIVPLNQQISAIYAFDEKMLAGWQTFDAALRPYLARMGIID